MIPSEMRSVAHWVLWRLEQQANGRPTKIPYSPITKKCASSTDPNTWTDYLTANDALTKDFDGVGFQAGAEPCGFILIDLDHCIVGEVLAQWAEEIVKKADTYTERSPFGDGLHCFLGGKLNKKSIKTDRAEIYDNSRYFTFTNNIYSGRDKYRQASQVEIDAIYEMVRCLGPQREERALNDGPQGRCVMSQTEIMERMFAAKNGQRIRALYDGIDITDHSRSDYALCSALAFWCDRDAKMMDVIFRTSKLYREKWDSKRGDTTYGWLTIAQTIAHCTNTYRPRAEKKHETFWYVGGSEKKPALKINLYDIIKFLQNAGFAKYYSGESVDSNYVYAENHLVSEASYGTMLDYLMEYIGSLPDDLPGAPGYTRDDLRSVFAAASTYYVGHDMRCIAPIELDTVRDTSDMSAVFFNDCWAHVSKEKTTKRPYSEMDGYIWKKQKLSRNYPENTSGEGEWAKFVFHACGKDVNIFESVKRALGYLLHRYKNPTHSVAIAFLDATIPEDDSPAGRSGKSLLASSVGKMRNSSLIDGKTFDTDDRFVYQNVNEDTDIVIIDDIKKWFNFENLFHLITGDFGIEKKGKNKIIIPFEKSPKIIFTSNYMLNGEGSSFEARVCEVALPSIYSKEFTPIMDFGHKLFDEWDKTEWEKFDIFMMDCLRQYLSEGMENSEHANLKIRKISQKTSTEFIAFCDDYFKDYKSPEINEGWELKKNLYHTYCEINESDKKKFTLVEFGKWLAKYMKYKGYKYKSAQKMFFGERGSYFRVEKP